MPAFFIVLGGSDFQGLVIVFVVQNSGRFGSVYTVKRLGLSIGRREVAVVGLRSGGRVDFSVRVPRVSRAAPHLEETLSAVLAQVPAGWRKASVRVAVSAGDLACSDLMELPLRSEQELEAVAGSLAEGRCAGETLEELAVDARKLGGGRVEILAIRRETLTRILAAIRAALPKARVGLVTALPSALAPLSSGGGVMARLAGEGVVVRANGKGPLAWRSFPLEEDGAAAERLTEAARSIGCENPDTWLRSGSDTLQVAFFGKHTIAPELLGAAAAALAVPERTGNLLRGGDEETRSMRRTLRGPLLAAGTAAALLLVAAGLHFDRAARQARADLERCEAREQRVWSAHLGRADYAPGELAPALRKAAKARQKRLEANKLPSALAFWAEIGKAMPSPEQTGFTLDLLQLGGEEGVLTGKVASAPNDPLANASSLERALDQCPKVAARGEFETRNAEILVRLRLDYAPGAAPAEGAK